MYLILYLLSLIDDDFVSVCWIKFIDGMPDDNKRAELIPFLRKIHAASDFKSGRDQFFGHFQIIVVLELFVDIIPHSFALDSAAVRRDSQ